MWSTLWYLTDTCQDIDSLSLVKLPLFWISVWLVLIFRMCSCSKPSLLSKVFLSVYHSLWMDPDFLFSRQFQHYSIKSILNCIIRNNIKCHNITCLEKRFWKAKSPSLFISRAIGTDSAGENVAYKRKAMLCCLLLSSFSSLIYELQWLNI